MSKKSAKIAAWIEQWQGQDLDAHYVGYFACFNQQLFYEAHDVLEDLWLQDRRGPDYAYYKGLIQLAGAFVHLQKNRLRPAGALFDLARNNLRQYPVVHQRLNLARVIDVIDDWHGGLQRTGFTVNPLPLRPPPTLQTLPGRRDG